MDKETKNVIDLNEQDFESIKNETKKIDDLNTQIKISERKIEEYQERMQARKRKQFKKQHPKVIDELHCEYFPYQDAFCDYLDESDNDILWVILGVAYEIRELRKTIECAFLDNGLEEN